MRPHERVREAPCVVWGDPGLSRRRHTYEAVEAGFPLSVLGAE